MSPSLGDCLLVQLSAPPLLSSRTCAEFYHLCLLVCKRGMIIEPISLGLLQGLTETKLVMHMARGSAPSLGHVRAGELMRSSQVHPGDV